MGWSSGTDLMNDVIHIMKKSVECESSRKKIYKKLISAFEGHDWDCQIESCGIDPMYDETLKDMYPEWFADDN